MLEIWLANVAAWLALFAGQPLPESLYPEADPRYGGQPPAITQSIGGIPVSQCGPSW